MLTVPFFFLVGSPRSWMSLQQLEYNSGSGELGWTHTGTLYNRTHSPFSSTISTNKMYCGAGGYAGATSMTTNHNLCSGNYVSFQGILMGKGKGAPLKLP